MKSSSALPLLASSLALGALSLWAQPTAGGSSPARATAEWTRGFESAEGYPAGQLPSTGPVIIMGGMATVMAGGAAEGTQFLRFVPTETDNALVLNLPPGVAAGGDRTLRFLVRLVDSVRNSRLVLSHGATVALRLNDAGLVVEAGTASPRQINVILPANGWLEIGVRESASTATWDLLVANRAEATGLPLLGDSPALLGNLLVFADGPLDLDAVRVTRATDGETKPADAPATADILKAVRAARASDWAQRHGDLLSQALARAKAGELAGLEVLVEGANAAEPGTARWHFEKAQALSILAYSLRDGGLHERAAAVGRLALRSLQKAGTMMAGEPGASSQHITCEFLAAQITEKLIGDGAEAARLYRRTLELKPGHSGAQAAEQRLARQRANADRDRAIARSGGGK